MCCSYSDRDPMTFKFCQPPERVATLLNIDDFNWPLYRDWTQFGFFWHSHCCVSRQPALNWLHRPCFAKEIGPELIDISVDETRMLWLKVDGPVHNPHFTGSIWFMVGYRKGNWNMYLCVCVFLQPLHGSPYHVYPINNHPQAVQAFQAPNTASLYNVSTSPLLANRSQKMVRTLSLAHNHHPSKRSFQVIRNTFSFRHVRSMGPACFSPCFVLIIYCVRYVCPLDSVNFNKTPTPLMLLLRPPFFVPYKIVFPHWLWLIFLWNWFIWCSWVAASVWPDLSISPDTI